MSDGGDGLSVAELAEYCRTQSRLLAGRSETLAAETDDLLDEIEEDIDEVRSRLASHSTATETAAPSSPTAGTDTADDLAALEQLETELEQKQSVAEAKRARMRAFQDLSEAYAELSSELVGTLDDGQDALERIVQFEQERDAPAYFDEQRTLLEIVADSEG